jgi:isopenicillin-N N-acyltransferase-like protein
LYFKHMKNCLQFCTKSKFDLTVSNQTIDTFIASNPESYFTYWIVGDYYKKNKDVDKAVLNYQTALTKEVATQKEANKINELLAECRKEKK